jgi:hypothetical protein
LCRLSSSSCRVAVPPVAVVVPPVALLPLAVVVSPVAVVVIPVAVVVPPVAVVGGMDGWCCRTWCAVVFAVVLRSCVKFLFHESGSTTCGGIHSEKKAEKVNFYLQQLLGKWNLF